MQAGDCKHYRGTMNKVCEKGVDLRKHVGGPDHGWVARLPCLEVFRREERCGKGSIVPCPLFEEPTPEEIEQEEREVREMFEQASKTFPLMTALKKKRIRGQDVRGVETCPVCQGTLDWRVSGYNGHVAMRCRTDGCVSLME